MDLVHVGLIIWVLSGVYMWWRLRQTRSWGSFAWLAGIVSFSYFLLAL